MHMKEELYKRVVLNNMSDQDIERIIAHKLERILCEEICVRKTELYEQIQKDVEDQRNRNEMFRKEIHRLSSFFADNDVRLVHIKGLILAEDIYEECPEIRKSYDIDILVAPKDAGKALDLLGKLGYIIKSENKAVSAQLKESHYRKVIAGAIHFPEFSVKIVHNEMEYEINMDFHIAIAHTMSDKEKKMNELVQRCEVQHWGTLPIYILEI